jgi:putrescine transport system permease protein
MRTGAFGKGWLAAGYLFLYLPIVSLVIFSFNDSPIANVWAGFTLDWYVKLASDSEMLSGLWLSLRIAFFSATGAVVLGTLAAFALVKYRRFGGRTLFSGMVNAPLVMPDVVIGISLLLMLVSIQRAFGHPERGSSRRRRWTWARDPARCSGS